MSFSFLKNLTSSNETSDNNDDVITKYEELKGELNASHLLLKDKDFSFNKKKEDYELQISKLADENKQLKVKFEKINNGKKQLENQNSVLEDRLLKIVEKYESEQKTLFEELQIAHSKLVEYKMQINELEDKKEQYRNDCNVAVNLLQCKPDDFVNHSYSALPINLKDRLKSILTDEEVLALQDQRGTEEEYEKKNANTLFKLPIFQPSAAAAMMYNMQTVSVQREAEARNLRSECVTTIDEVSNKCSEDIHNPSNLIEDPVGTEAAKINKQSDNVNRAGKVSSSLIAQVLRKDKESPSKKSFKLLPYICLRCKKETVICEQSSQTNSSDITQRNSNVLMS